MAKIAIASTLSQLTLSLFADTLMLEQNIFHSGVR